MSRILERLGASKEWKPWVTSPDPERGPRVRQILHPKLPEDYLEVMVATDGGDVIGEVSDIGILNTAELLEDDWDTDRLMENIPGAIMFGIDGGGSFMYYDADNKLGYGHWAVFLVGLADQDRDGSMFVGNNLTEVIEAIISGENLYDRPALGDQ